MIGVLNGTATTEIYTLSLHDALPILRVHVQLARPRDDVLGQRRRGRGLVPAGAGGPVAHVLLVEARLAVPGLVEIGEHTSELQSRQYLVCRLLLEKKYQKSNLLVSDR